MSIYGLNSLILNCNAPIESVIRSDVVPSSLPVAVAILKTGIRAVVDWFTFHPASDIHSSADADSFAV